MALALALVLVLVLVLVFIAGAFVTVLWPYICGSIGSIVCMDPEPSRAPLDTHPSHISSRSRGKGRTRSRSRCCSVDTVVCYLGVRAGGAEAG